MRWRYFKQNVFFLMVRGSALCIALAIGAFLLYIFYHGVGVISWSFLTEPPRDSMTKGGIMPAILGTFYLTLGAISVAFPWDPVGRLPQRIRQTGTGGADHPDRSELPGGRPFHRLRPFRPRALRGVSPIRVFHRLRGADPGLSHPPHDHRSVGGSPEGGSQHVPRGLPGARRVQVADDPPDRSSQRAPGNSHRLDPGHRPRRRGNGAHHVHGGRLFHAPSAPVHLRPGHGAALPRLRSGDRGDPDRGDEADPVRHHRRPRRPRSRHRPHRHLHSSWIRKKKRW